MATYGEIIYCRDCKYLKVYYHEVNRYSYECSRWEKLNIQPFDYCSRAEYKKERMDEVEE